VEKIIFSKHAKQQMLERGALEREVITMKISYDPEVDAAYIRLKEGRYEVSTQRLTEDIAVNYAPDGSVIGIEILYASKYLVKHNKPQIKLENLQPA